MIKLSSNGISKLIQHFKQRVEDTSPHEDKVWDYFVVDINILAPNEPDYWMNPIKPVLVKPSWGNPYPDGGWIRNVYINKFNFALQCNYFAKDGTYTAGQMSQKPRERHDYFALHPHYRRETFLSNRFMQTRTMPEETIATYIYVKLLDNSAERRSSHSVGEIKVKELSEGLWPSNVSKNLTSKIIDVLTTSFYQETFPDHLHYMATHERWFPYMNESCYVEKREMFENEYELISHFADEFVALSSEYSVFNFNEVANKEESLFTEIDSYVLKMELKMEADSNKLLEEDLLRERNAIERDRKLDEQYPKLSRMSLYTDSKPTIFQKIPDIHRQWRKLDKENLEKLVWSSPLSTLGYMFGKSDNAVRKWAKEKGILLPVGGYWNKVAHGKIAYPNGKVDIAFARVD